MWVASIVLRLCAALLSLSFLFLLAACSDSGEQGPGGGPAVQGQPAPLFSFQSQPGRTYFLPDFRGKVVVVNFWATWCPPCRDEMPSLEQLYQRLDKGHFALLALSVDDSWEPVSEFLKKGNFTLPVYADFDHRISSLYGTVKYPESFVLDKRGIVALKIIGATDWVAPEMVQFLEKLMVEKG